VLGLTEAHPERERISDASIWLDAGGTVVMLERSAPGEVRLQDSSMELVCFAVEPSGCDAILERVLEAGVAIESRTAFSVYFRDPDGRRVGLSSWPARLE
jgi:glyoxylase I family protein